MKIRPLKFEGTFLVELAARTDERGYFMRTYDQDTFRGFGLQTQWVQENQTLSLPKGLVRGLHFQMPPFCETKLVRVIRGAILDVFVDLRDNSGTYGKWDSIELNQNIFASLYLPKGFAHGFCTLSENTIIQYKMDCVHSPESESGIRWDDPQLAILWPTTTPILSAKDSNLRTFKQLNVRLNP